MRTTSRNQTLALVLGFATLAGCSGSTSSSTPTISLSVTDAASDQLSTFVIGVESVSLLRVLGAPVSLLDQPTAVDFAALSDLSRLLNVTEIPADDYTGIEVVLLFDGDRVFINEVVPPAPALLVDASGTPLAGTQTLTIDFPVPLSVSSGNHVVELDLDLNNTTDVDVGGNQVYLEPTLLPRVDRADPKEHALGGDLRSVVLDRSLFRVGVDALVAGTTVVEVSVGPGTVFQVDGVPLLGAAGLSALDALPPNAWVQAFGGMNRTTSRFQAATVEAGTGSYNGGTYIVEGVITRRTGGAGTDTVLTVRGHSSDPTHIEFKFNLDFLVDTSFLNTKVVRRGSATVYDTDDLNIGQKVRMFGVLSPNPPYTLDVTTASDVIRMEPTWVAGLATGAAAGGELELDLARVDVRDAGIFTWTDGGATPADPDAFVVDDSGNLTTGQGITNGTPVVALGFFSAVDDTGPDFVPVVLANRDLLPSVLVIRDRSSGLAVTTTADANSIDFTFTGVQSGLEKGVVDQGFVGQTDITVSGISIVPKPGTLGLGLYLLHDRTLNMFSVFLSFSAFSQALDDALMGGATLFNVGSLGVFDDVNDRIPSAWTAVTVQ